MPGRLRIHNAGGREGAVVTINSRILEREKPVYFHVLNRPLEYAYGRSRIAYIGTTRQGLERIMSSIAERAADAFDLHGITSIEVHEIGCAPRQRVETSKKLERACLLVFRERYGEVPRFNSHGSGIEETDEFVYFNKSKSRGLSIYGEDKLPYAMVETNCRYCHMLIRSP